MAYLYNTGYSSGENYAFLEAKGLCSYIPLHGTYKGGPDGFKYHKADDCYTCPQGKVIPFKKVFFEKKNHTKKKEYRALKPVCVDCPIRSACLGKSAQEKKFTVTFYREGYERNNARVNSPRGSYMKGKGQSTVEPVLGTLTQFLGLRKINTIGIDQANKVMHLSAIAYNLKKYLKFTAKTVKSDTKAVCYVILNIKTLITLQIRLLTSS
ncbi:transposase [Flavivirga aquimarina]|uniref:Transposase n=1 Tax=Flavivirga aquimarina TaxID=2027862 RepID=A0ABT8W908_9FLAO|nr:transposase [Flavivirga aquimarina]MDO5969614.1 transposase [Flavivirga aquimarina]